MSIVLCFGFKFGGGESLIERVSFEQSLTSDGAGHVDIWGWGVGRGSVLGRGNSQCKGLGVRVAWSCPGYRKVRMSVWLGKRWEAMRSKR